MEFTFKLNEEQLNVIIKHLDMGPHKEVRGVLDYLIGNANAQAQAARDAMTPPPDGAPSSTNP